MNFWRKCGSKCYYSVFNAFVIDALNQWAF